MKQKLSAHGSSGPARFHSSLHEAGGNRFLESISQRRRQDYANERRNFESVAADEGPWGSLVEDPFDRYQGQLSASNAANQHKVRLGRRFTTRMVTNERKNRRQRARRKEREGGKPRRCHDRDESPVHVVAWLALCALHISPSLSSIFSLSFSFSLPQWSFSLYRVVLF